MKSMLMLICVLCASVVFAQNNGHFQGVDKRGDSAMGFSHEKVAHHFRLYKDGGAIEAVVKDPSDKPSVQAIQHHMAMIAQMFSEGNFDLPMFIHDREVPGTTAMKALKAQIMYHYQDLPLGGRVRIMTKNRRALHAVHDFLQFQVKDHRTGDKGKVESDAMPMDHKNCPMMKG